MYNITGNKHLEGRAGSKNNTLSHQMVHLRKIAKKKNKQTGMKGE